MCPRSSGIPRPGKNAEEAAMQNRNIICLFLNAILGFLSSALPEFASIWSTLQNHVDAFCPLDG